MLLEGIFKCQDCGATRTNLTQDTDKRMVCADRTACAIVRLLEVGEVN